MSDPQAQQNTQNPQPAIRQPSVMLSDLTSELLWPKLFRAPALALAPSRLIAGSICVFLLASVLQIIFIFAPTPSSEAPNTTGFYAQLEGISNRFELTVRSIVDSIFSLDPIALTQSIWLAVITIRDMIMQSPLISLLVGVPLIAILAITGGTISRSTAIEFGQGRYAPREDTLGFTLKRTRQFVCAVIGPVIICAIAFLIIALGGLLLSTPIIDILGAILYPIGLIMGIVATIVLCLHVFALPLIVPALAIEGTDAFDAVQRSYAYVISKPLRYIAYAAILLVLGVFSAGIFTLVAEGSVAMTDWAAQLIANPSTAQALDGQGELGATKNIAHTIILIVKAFIKFIVSGYLVSIFFTSSSLLYLFTRRINDGQDTSEVWDGLGE